MSAKKSVAIGSITWADLTVKDAGAIREFYRKVAGWTSTEAKMGDYSDYCMNEPTTGKTAAGICHARGVNADLPPQWLVYITVENLEKSIASCVENRGKVVAGPRSMGEQGKICVIQDPAGAVAALFEQKM
jgi:hypothetical protein